MAVRTREELINLISARIGEDTSDEAISLLEDVTDTINDYETRISPDGVDWRQRYNDNDSAWRKKYKERFSSPIPDAVTNSQTTDINTQQVDEPQKPLEYDDLFKTE